MEPEEADVLYAQPIFNQYEVIISLLSPIPDESAQYPQSSLASGGRGRDAGMPPPSIHRRRRRTRRSDPIRSPHLHFDDGRRRYRIPLKFARPSRDVRRNPIPLQNCPICLRGTPPTFFGTGGREVGRAAPPHTLLSKRGSSVQCHGCIQREEARRRERCRSHGRRELFTFEKFMKKSEG